MYSCVKVLDPGVTDSFKLPYWVLGIEPGFYYCVFSDAEITVSIHFVSVILKP